MIIVTRQTMLICRYIVANYMLLYLSPMNNSCPIIVAKNSSNNIFQLNASFYIIYTILNDKGILFTYSIVQVQVGFNFVFL